VDFERQRRDVLVGQLVRDGADQGWIGDDGDWRVDQVEDGAQVDRERILALSHEEAAGLAAAGDVDRVDVLGGVTGVVGNRLHADVVHRLVEGGAAAGGVGQRATCTLATVAALHLDREGLGELQAGVLDVGHLAGLDQRDVDRLVTDRQIHACAIAGQRVLEAELEADVLDRVAVVVHVDLVHRVRVHREVVRAAIGVLQRLVVGDQRHVVAAAGLVAAEHVEVGRIHLGRGGDERGFPVAGRQAHAGGQCHRGSNGQCGEVGAGGAGGEGHGETPGGALGLAGRKGNSAGQISLRRPLPIGCSDRNHRTHKSVKIRA